MEERDKTRPAGGYATQRGINYQHRVAAFFAASSLSENAAFPGLPASPIESIRCETGEPLADILLTFENGGIAFVEVKPAFQPPLRSAVDGARALRAAQRRASQVRCDKETAAFQLIQVAFAGITCAFAVD